MSDEILDRIRENSPVYGGGMNIICQQCREKMNREHDVEHRICDKLVKLVWPSCTTPEEQMAWADIHDLLRLRTGQHGGQT